MNIWKIWTEGDHKAFIRIDEHGNETHETRYDYLDRCPKPEKRILKEVDASKTLADYMIYFSGNGTAVLSNRAKEILELNFSNEKIQFFPATCDTLIGEKLWIINVYDYVDVLDIENCEYTTMKNRKGETIIANIRKYSFKPEVFDHKVFKIYENGMKNRFDVFATDDYIKVLDENSLTGWYKVKVFEY